MKRWPRTLTALAMTLCAQAAVAQSRASDTGFDLLANYPNPFVEATTIPFTLDEALFSGDSPVTVTMSVFNLMAHSIAHPVALGHPSGAISVQDLSYEAPGRYEARWTGLDDNGEVVAAGIYVLDLRIGDQHVSRRVVRAEAALN